MKISRTLLAKELSVSNDRSGVITMIQTLLVLMRKFGKSLNNPEVSSVLSKKFPKEFGLYEVLGRSHCTIAQCQQLLVSVSNLMDTNHLDVSLPGDSLSLDTEPEDTISFVPGSMLGLSVVGKGKIYKRSLDSDLMKMIRMN